MKSRTTIPQRYEAGEFAIYILLFVLTLIGFAAAFGCAGADEYQGDELGTEEQGLTSKFSTNFTGGYAQSNLTLCTPNGANPCIIPGRSTVRYKFIGTDPCDTPTSRVSWKQETLRGLNDLKNAMNAFGGNPFTLVEDTANPSVTFQKGSCAGSSDSSTLNAFFCASHGSLVSVANPSGTFGTYKRHDGVLAVTIDDKKARIRTLHVDSGSCLLNSDLHALLEHIGHAAALLPFGGSISASTYLAGPGFPGLEFPDPNYPSWATPDVFPNYSSQNPYDAAGYPGGLICRLNSYRTSQPTSQYIRAAGTCVD